MVTLIVLGGSKVIEIRKKWLREKLLQQRKMRKGKFMLLHEKNPAISEYLSANRILFFEGSLSQKDVIRSLVAILSLENTQKAEEAIYEREESGSTVVASGVAFPHARLLGLERAAAALGICPSGISVAAEKDPVYLFFLFLSPLGKNKEHLSFLTGASSLFLQENFLQKVLRHRTASEILQEIKHFELGE